MKKYTLFAALLVLMSFTTALTINWKLKKEGYKVSYELLSNPATGKGDFTRLQADISFDPAAPGKEGAVVEGAKIKAVVEVNSLSTPNPKLTEHLLSADFFNAAKFPEITFTSATVKHAANGSFVAEGTLALKDSVQPVVLPFTFENKGKEGILKGKLEVLAADYGIMQRKSPGTDKVIISIEAPVTRE